jgi:hypothetical protein
LFVPSHQAHGILMEIVSDEKTIQFDLEQMHEDEQHELL